MVGIGSAIAAGIASALVAVLTVQLTLRGTARARRESESNAAIGRVTAVLRTLDLAELGKATRLVDVISPYQRTVAEAVFRESPSTVDPDAIRYMNEVLAAINEFQNAAEHARLSRRRSEARMMRLQLGPSLLWLTFRAAAELDSRRSNRRHSLDRAVLRTGEDLVIQAREGMEEFVRELEDERRLP